MIIIINIKVRYQLCRAIYSQFTWSNGVRPSDIPHSLPISSHITYTIPYLSLSHRLKSHNPHLLFSPLSSLLPHLSPIYPLPASPTHPPSNLTILIPLPSHPLQHVTTYIRWPYLTTCPDLYLVPISYPSDPHISNDYHYIIYQFVNLISHF